MIVTRPAVPVVSIGLGMRQAIRMGGNFPMLESMRGVSHSQERQASQPKHPPSASRDHAFPKLSSAMAWSNPFTALNQAHDGLRGW